MCECCERAAWEGFFGGQEDTLEEIHCLSSDGWSVGWRSVAPPGNVVGEEGADASVGRRRRRMAPIRMSSMYACPPVGTPSMCPSTYHIQRPSGLRPPDRITHSAQHLYHALMGPISQPGVSCRTGVPRHTSQSDQTGLAKEKNPVGRCQGSRARRCSLPSHVTSPLHPRIGSGAHVWLSDLCNLEPLTGQSTG